MEMFSNKNIVQLVIWVILCMDLCMAVKWLALFKSRTKKWNFPDDCKKSSGLTSEQVRICEQHVSLMETVAQASLKGVDACQKQFSDRRWNCSTITSVPKMTKDLKRGTREQAFVYGIASATLIHSVARACSIGATNECTCGAFPLKAPSDDFKWGGCGDNVDYGLRFTELFTSYHTIKNSKRKKTMMNAHNTAAGTQVAISSRTKACKCHGVSGSCSIKTCWPSLADFNKIAETLKHKYGRAIEVKRKRKKGVSMFAPINKNVKSIPNDELVYIQKSPDYCSPDRKMGSIGTQGRNCDRDSHDSGGCDIMCCGRGYDSSDVQIFRRCECKYYWCCEVKCNTCSEIVRVHRCR
ncbi:Protein Wnt-11 [Mactra antiquata]